MVHVRLHDLVLCGGRAVVLAGVPRTALWSGFDYLELAPGQGYAPSPSVPSADAALVLLEGRAEAQAGQARACAAAPGVLLAPAGVQPTVRNPGSGRLRALHVAVGPALGPARGAGSQGERSGWRTEVADRARLFWRPALHGGRGRMATRHLWGRGDFSGAWTFLDHALLETRGTLGRHYHEAGEEVFVVLRGEGVMSVGEATFAVGPGSVTFQGIGQGHGLDNPGPGELEFLRIAVALPGQVFTTVDLPRAAEAPPGPA
ncbi:MAG: cupin domain-containing protein [Candidatus Latescibacterota bacterium]